MSLFDDLVDSTGDVANNVGDSARNMIESSINAENLLSTLRQNGDAAMSLLESFVNLGRQIDANKAVAIGLALAQASSGSPFSSRYCSIRAAVCCLTSSRARNSLRGFI